jgi:hypothetical protein
LSTGVAGFSLRQKRSAGAELGTQAEACYSSFWLNDKVILTVAIQILGLRFWISEWLAMGDGQVVSGMWKTACQRWQKVL